jgi:hypothetical protein
MGDDTRIRLRVSNEKAYVWDVDGNNLFIPVSDEH